MLDDVLEGGVNSSLDLDGHGKSLSFLLLAAPIRSPRDLLDAEGAESALQAGNQHSQLK